MHVFDGLPFWLTFVVFFLGAVVRGGATYWAGRGLRSGAGQTRWASRLDGVAVQRAEGVVARFGPLVVALSFLTVGVQTAVNAAAGAMRMPGRHYLAGLMVGALMWAAFYTTAGAAVVRAVAGQASWWWAVLAVVLVGLVALVSPRIERSWRAKDR